MVQTRIFIALLTLAVFSARQVEAAPIDDLTAAAKKEGTIEFFAAGTLGAEGAQKLGEAFNKKYGFNLKTIYHPSSGMARDIAKVITLASSGGTRPIQVADGYCTLRSAEVSDEHWPRLAVLSIAPISR